MTSATGRPATRATGTADMRMLKTKLPPPLVALALALCMWLLAPATSALDGPAAFRIALSALLASVGTSLGIAGSVSFRRAKTTINPFKPERASTLVATGVYRFSRNPMYLGMLVGLLAVAVYLASPWSLIGPLIFVGYMNRRQIAPEESALEAKFGASYLEYKQRVPRWL